MVMEHVTWRLQVHVCVVKGEMKLSASLEITFLILILRHTVSGPNGMPDVTACLCVQGTGRLCVSWQRKSGRTAAPFSRRTADLRAAVLAFSFHPK